MDLVSHLVLHLVFEKALIFVMKSTDIHQFLIVIFTAIIFIHKANLDNLLSGFRLIETRFLNHQKY